jgi:hypothetical protein
MHFKIKKGGKHNAKDTFEQESNNCQNKASFGWNHVKVLQF